MLRSMTTLVVGAGASCEADFPDGRGLLENIERQLNILYDRSNHQTQGDRLIANAILQRCRNFGDEFNQYIRSAWRIRDAAVLGLSIDNIIEQHDDDDRVAYVGKLAIVSAILSAERSSLLMPSIDDPDKLDLRRIKDSWYIRFAQQLMEGVPRRNAANIFDNLRIVCFNYDRTIEHFLPYSLSEGWGIPIEEARQLVRERLHIVHPYGTVASLISPGNYGIAFGGPHVQAIDQLWENIRTFSERNEEVEELDRIRRYVAEAEQIIFIGFAFHQQNMDLLHCEAPAAKRALATVWKLPYNEKSQIQKNLREGMFRLDGGNAGLVMHDGNCSSLFSDNWRTITN